jgi:hypothetical protein
VIPHASRRSAWRPRTAGVALLALAGGTALAQAGTTVTIDGVTMTRPAAAALHPGRAGAPASAASASDTVRPPGVLGKPPRPRTHAVIVDTFDWSCGYHKDEPGAEVVDHRGTAYRIVEAAAENKPGSCREVLELALGRGADPDGRIQYPYDVFKLRLHGSPLWTSLDNGDTALMLAAQRGRLDLVDTLLKGGADPQRTNRFGKTALMFAAERGDLAVMRALLAAGARVDPVASEQRNRGGADYSGSALRFALNHARRAGDAAPAQLLLDRLRPGDLPREEIERCLGGYGPLPPELVQRVQALRAR